MADTNTNISAPVIAPVAAPTVTPAPEAVASPPAAVVETVPVTAPVIETPVVEAPKPAETVLATALDTKPAETKPADAPPAETPKEEPKAEETKSEEGSQSEEPTPPPTYEDFKAPEGIQLDKEVVKKFTDILGELEGKSKADHALIQEFGQKAVDFHINEVKQAVENVTKLYQTTWERQKTEWKDAFLKDPEIGGNRFQTTVDSALSFIRTHGGTPEQQAEFRNAMETSGLGNHIAVIRLLANAGRAMAEGQPLAASKPAVQVKSKTATLYGKSS